MYKTIIRKSHSWTTPSGYNTSINVYNCITKQLAPLVVRDKNAVSWYTCGPTVYDSPHVGHGSCYVKLDIIQRILRQHFQLNLVTCMNITDIDDKIIKKAVELRADYKQVSEKFEEEFWTDLNALNVPKPDIVLRVTKHIDSIVQFIEKLIHIGAAYQGKDKSIYFDHSKAPYPPGKLQKATDSPEDCSNPAKKAAADFALWKSGNTRSESVFDSPWGPGRPGWHIECSTLASLVFGSCVDIHAGGLDLRFPHHENEELQSCMFHDNQQWVNYWIHPGQLHLNNSEKMSKSLKNTVSIQDMLKETDADVFRVACAKSHYRNPMEYSGDLLKTAKNSLEGYKNLFRTVNDVTKGLIKPTLNNQVLISLLAKSIIGIHKAFCDDFNTSQVFKILNEITSSANSMVYTSASSSEHSDLYYLLALNNVIMNTLKMFGINLNTTDNVSVSEDVGKFIDLLVEFRQEVRNIGLKSKQAELLSLSDGVRDNLNKYGYIVKDRSSNSSWSR